MLSRIIRRGLHEYENSIAEECKRMFMLKGWLMLIYGRNTKGENEVQVTLYDIIAYIPAINSQSPTTEPYSYS